MGLDIIRWLATGDFLGVKIGMSNSEVVSLLGEPEGWADSKATNKVDSFRDSDMWGYGIWVLYFTEGKLDAITGLIEGLTQESYYFDIVGFAPCVTTLYRDVVANLIAEKLKYYELLKKFKLKNVSTGEVVEKRRRLGDRTLLIGDNLLGRITFDRVSNQILQVAYPYSVTAQVVSGSALKFKKELSLFTG